MDASRCSPLMFTVARSRTSQFVDFRTVVGLVWKSHRRQAPFVPATMRDRPSAENLPSNPPASPSAVVAPVLTSTICVRQYPGTTRRCPSGLNETERELPLLVIKRDINNPSLTRKSLTARSVAPVASVAPSGLNATVVPLDS